MTNRFHSRATLPVRRENSFKSGFTLIELLVVIAIIALLAAILFPVFARARENARRSSCQSNLKQIALGIKQYSQDYDEYFPMVWQTAGAANGWAEYMQPYVKSEQIFQCPSQVNRETWAASGDNLNKWGYSDYFYNGNLGVVTSTTYCPGQKLVIKEAEVDSSAVVVMIGDGGRGGINNIANSPPQPSYTAGAAVAETTDNTRRPNTRYYPGWYTKSPAGFGTWAFSDGTNLQKVNESHLEGMNIGFVDGHVKWYKPDKLTFNNPGTGDPTFKINDNNGGISAAKTGCQP